MLSSFLSSESGLSSGGTITGDLTIDGDLTVDGDGSGNYDEIVNGNLVLSAGSKLGIGIGDADPAEDLHISSTGRASIRIQGTATSDGVISDVQFFNSTDSVGAINMNRVSNNDQADMTFHTQPNSGAVTERMRIDSSGNVGIGEFAPEAPLHVKGSSFPVTVLERETTTTNAASSTLRLKTTLTSGSMADGFGSELQFTIEDGAAANQGIGAIKAVMANSDDNTGNLVLMPYSNGSQVSAMTLAYNGNVGIGNTAPDTLLEIEKSVSSGSGQNAFLTLSATDGGVNMAGGEGASILFKIPDDETNPSVGASIAGLKENSDDSFSNTALTFSISQNDETLDEALRIDSSGNVGIGTAAPDTLLHLYSTSASKPILKIENEQGGANPVSIQLLRNTSSPADDDFIGQIDFRSMNDAGTPEEINYAYITGQSTDITDGTEDGELQFYTMKAGTSTNTMTLQSGLVGLGNSALETWKTDMSVLQIGGDGSIAAKTTAAAGNDFFIARNAYWDSTNNRWEYMSTNGDDEAERLVMANGTYAFDLTGTAGADDAAITFTTALQLDSNSRISLSNNDAGGDNANTIFGKLAGASTATGAAGNVLIGEEAGNDLTIADHNTVVGYQAFDLVTTLADGNTSIGWQSMHGSIVAENVDNCVAIGKQSLTGALESEASGSVAVGYSALAALTSGAGNTAVGYSAGQAITDGDYNTVLGYNAFITADSGEGYNTVIGWEAGKTVNHPTADHNVFIGAKAGYGQTGYVLGECVAIGSECFDGTGANSVSGVVAIGKGAMSGVVESTANGSVAIGGYSLGALTSGAGNTAIGYQAGLALTTGSSNTVLGYGALDDMVEGGNNIAIGKNAIGGALDATADASTHNVAVGKDALGGAWVTAVSEKNVGIGNETLMGAMNGVTGAVAIGHSALTALTTGAGNVAVGYSSLAANTGGGYNIAIGYNSMLVHDGGLRNIAIGYGAMDDTDAGSVSKASDDNVFIGYSAGGGTWANQDNSNCIGIGTSALSGALEGNNTDGSIAIGSSALAALTSGAGNVAVGYTAGAEEVAGNDNTMIGYEALHDGGGLANLSNTVIGSGAGGGTWANTASSYNTIVGQAAMGGALDGALHNVAVGFVSGGAITEGQRNTFVGGAAGNSCTTGDKNTSIGNDSDVAAAVDNQIAIGYSTEVTAQYGIAIGDDITAGTNDAVMGKNGAIITVDFDADGTWAQSSDIRKKRNIKDDSLGLSFINDLKTKTFQWKPAEEHPDEWGHFKVDEDGNKVYVDVNTDIVMHGMIAQEVKESLDKAGCDTFGGWKVGDNGQQELSKASFVIPLIKAVQELTARVKELEDA